MSAPFCGGRRALDLVEGESIFMVVFIVVGMTLSFLYLSYVFSSKNLQIQFRASAVAIAVCDPLSFLSLSCVFFFNESTDSFLFICSSFHENTKKHLAY